jgi:hypothetical protein
MPMNDELIAAAREARDEARKRARLARLAAEEAEDELRRAEEAYEELKVIWRGLDDFNAGASTVLS